MEKNLKPDGYYIDQYDRSTIKQLKEIEKNLNISIDWSDSHRNRTMKDEMEIIKLRDKAILRARFKDEAITSWKQSDEHQDMLITKTPSPKNIKCSKCSTEMYLVEHYFQHDGIELLFVFKCPNEHFPLKILIYHIVKPHFIPFWV